MCVVFRRCILFRIIHCILAYYKRVSRSDFPIPFYLLTVIFQTWLYSDCYNIDNILHYIFIFDCIYIDNVSLYIFISDFYQKIVDERLDNLISKDISIFVVPINFRYTSGWSLCDSNYMILKHYVNSCGYKWPDKFL